MDWLLEEIWILKRYTDLSVHCPEYFVAVCFFCLQHGLMKKNMTTIKYFLSKGKYANANNIYE